MTTAPIYHGGGGAVGSWPAASGHPGDYTVKVTVGDTTNDYLRAKMAAGTGITLSIGSPGGNETVVVTNSAPETYLSIVTPADAVANTLQNKFYCAPGSGLSLTIQTGVGGEQYIELANTLPEDHKVLVNPADVLPELLFDKLMNTGNMTLTSLDKGGGAWAVGLYAAGDHKVLSDSADATPKYLYNALTTSGPVGLSLVGPVGNLKVQITGPAVTNIGSGLGFVGKGYSGLTLQLRAIDGDSAAGIGVSTDLVNDIVVVTSLGYTRVTLADTTPDILNGKIVVAGGLSKSVLNPGGVEQLQISGAGIVGDHKVSATSTDSTYNYLLNKLLNGDGNTLAIEKNGADGSPQTVKLTVQGTLKATPADNTAETLIDKVANAGNMVLSTIDKGGGNLAVTFAATDKKAAVTLADTTPDILNNKIAVTGGLSKAVLNPGANEQVQISGAGIVGDHKVMVSSADTTPGYLDASPTGGKIAQEGFTLEYHDAGGNEQLNMYPIPGFWDNFDTARGFWEGTKALTSGDWTIDTVNKWLVGAAASSAYNWIRAGLDGDFDYFAEWLINGATTVGFRFEGAGIVFELKWNANQIIRTCTGEGNTTQAWAQSSVFLRIKRTGTYFRFYYRLSNTGRWTEWTAANLSKNLGNDITISLISSVNAHIDNWSIWDSYFPERVRGILAKMMPVADGASITPNAFKGYVNTVVLGGNRTIAAPATAAIPDGTMFILRLRQDASPPRTVTWNAIYRFPSGTAPTLSTGANKTDYFGFIYNAVDTKFDCIAQEFNL